jgi:hypothetical protein
LGSFFHNRKASDGSLRVTSLYITRLIGAERPFKGRIFLKGQYIRGINRTSPSDQVDLRDVDALRGIQSNLLFGNTVIAGGVTVSVFSPWQLLGFRVALFSIADLTYFSKANEFILSNRPYWGISSGVRLNNQNFILGTINFSISIYPAPPEGIGFFKVGLALNPIFPFPNFIAKKPSVVKYGNPSKLYY